LEPEFKPGQGTYGSLTAMVRAATLLPDGSIVAAGNFTNFSNLACMGAVRLVDPVKAPAPPMFIGEAMNETIGEGESLLLSADARGGLPLSFQWLRNGQKVLGATSMTLALKRLGADQGGEYAVLITNAVGAVTSLVARITVAVPQPMRWTVDPGFAPELWHEPVVKAVVVQPDDRVLIAGEFSQVNGVLRRRIARLNPNGTLDPAFDPGENVALWPEAMVLQPDGKVVVGGYLHRLDSGRATSVARLNADGTLDGSFQFAEPGLPASALLLQPDGRLVVAGSFVSQLYWPRCGLIRVGPDGRLDETFASPEYGRTYADATLDPAGRVLAVGYFGARTGVDRFNSDGSLDQTFPVADYPSTIALQPDGRILLGGNKVSRLTPDGAPDSEWQIADPNAESFSLAVQRDGRVLVGGSFTAIGDSNRKGLLRLNPDGTLDPAFDARLDGTSWTRVQSVALAHDGGILAGGSFSHVGDRPASGLVRLQPDGTPDPGFVVELKRSGAVYALATRGPTNLLVGGEFLTLNGENQVRCASLSREGAPRTDVYTYKGPDSTIFAMASLGNDARSLAVVGGSFQNVNGLPSRGVAAIENGRFRSIGTIGFPGVSWPQVHAALVRSDGENVALGGSFGVVLADKNLRDFDSAAAIDGDVLALANGENSTLFVGGSFNRVGGLTRHSLARLKPSAAPFQSLILDTNFLADLPPGAAVTALKVLEDGELLAGGRFASVSGVGRANLVRLNRDGSPDASFDPGLGANDQVRALLVLPNGRAIVAGDFTTLDGADRRRLGRLLWNGRLDETLRLGAGADGRVNALLLLDDQSLVVGGEFTAFDGVRRTGLARLVPQPVAPLDPPQLWHPTLGASGFSVTITAQAGVTYRLESKAAPEEVSWTIVAEVLGAGADRQLTDPAPTSSQRFYRVTARE
jgi:uncharacterized delta-60 repeat protein